MRNFLNVDIMIKEKPLADHSFEENAFRIFNMDISPEEWVARNAHILGVSSFNNYSYKIKKLEKYIYKVHKYLLSKDKKIINNLRKQFLTKEEILLIEKR